LIRAQKPRSKTLSCKGKGGGDSKRKEHTTLKEKRNQKVLVAQLLVRHLGLGLRVRVRVDPNPLRSTQHL